MQAVHGKDNEDQEVGDHDRQIEGIDVIKAREGAVGDPVPVIRKGILRRCKIRQLENEAHQMNCSLCRLNLFCELHSEAQPPRREARMKICRRSTDVCRHRLDDDDYKAATPDVNEARCPPKRPSVPASSQGRSTIFPKAPGAITSLCA